MSDSNFRKVSFHPKITFLVALKVKLPNMTDWHNKKESYRLVGYDLGDFQVISFLSSFVTNLNV